ASVLTAGGGTGPSLFLAPWGIPFILIGLYMVGGRFVVRAITSRRTRYVITDRRVLVIGGLSNKGTTSAYLSSLPPPVITVGPDGSGSLTFGAFSGIWDAFSRKNRWRAWASEPIQYPWAVAYPRGPPGSRHHPELPGGEPPVSGLTCAAL